MNNNITAKVIKDSQGESEYPTNRTRLITIEYTAPKFLLAEINTHRMMVKNASSARSEPTKSFQTHIFVPTKVGVNKPGMQASEFLSGDTLHNFQEDWKSAYETVCNLVDNMVKKYNPHKQTINRLLEPFIIAKGVITATLPWWEHFLRLRNSKYAQPEIEELASKIDIAIKGSTPQILKEGQWHLPYVDSVLAGEDNVNLKISASCIAQVSYRKLDDSLEKALSIFDKLNILSKDYDNPPHISPVQHLAVYVPNPYTFEEAFSARAYQKPFFSEFKNFIQCSKFVENCNCLNIIGDTFWD